MVDAPLAGFDRLALLWVPLNALAIGGVLALALHVGRPSRARDAFSDALPESARQRARGIAGLVVPLGALALVVALGVWALFGGRS